MQNLPRVNVVKRLAELNEPTEDFIIGKRLSRLFQSPEVPLEITSCCILHDDADPVLMSELVKVLDDVWVANCLQ